KARSTIGSRRSISASGSGSVTTRSQTADAAPPRDVATVAGADSMRVSRRLLQRQQFDFEDERRVRRDRAVADVSVGERWRDDQLAEAPDFHAGQALVPSLDDGSSTQRER